jgi:hypothetical protein
MWCQLPTVWCEVSLGGGRAGVGTKTLTSCLALAWGMTSIFRLRANGTLSIVPREWITHTSGVDPIRIDMKIVKMLKLPK